MLSFSSLHVLMFLSAPLLTFGVVAGCEWFPQARLVWGAPAVSRAETHVLCKLQPKAKWRVILADALNASASNLTIQQEGIRSLCGLRSAHADAAKFPSRDVKRCKICQVHTSSAS